VGPPEACALRPAIARAADAGLPREWARRPRGRKFYGGETRRPNYFSLLFLLTDLRAVALEQEARPTRVA